MLALIVVYVIQDLDFAYVISIMLLPMDMLHLVLEVTAGTLLPLSRLVQAVSHALAMVNVATHPHISVIALWDGLDPTAPKECVPRMYRGSDIPQQTM